MNMKNPHKKRKANRSPPEDTEVVESGDSPSPAKDLSKDFSKDLPTPSKNVKQRLTDENAFISGILDLVSLQHQTKQAVDSDDEVEYVYDEEKQKALHPTATSRAHSLQELNDKLAKLKGNFPTSGPKKGKKKLTKIEKKQKAREMKKMKKKMQTIAKGKSMAENLKKTAKPVKPVYNSEGKMVFSKFDFSEQGGGTGEVKKQNLDPKSALKKIEGHKQKIKKLEEIGKTNRVKAIEEAANWKMALDKAEGVKVKDDVTLLKKSIKKQEQRKKSSKKKWEERVDGVEKRKAMKQQKRTENIQKRKQENKKNKMKKAVKNGRTVPGFG